MFEDFRKQFEDSSFPDDDQKEESNTTTQLPEQKNFLGMTPIQRFLVALMLLLMITILGLLFLIVTSRIVPPFLH